MVHGTPVLATLIGLYVASVHVSSNKDASALKSQSDQIDKLCARLGDKAPALALLVGTLLLLSTQPGCLPKRTPAEVASDAVALDECINAHWGEDFFHLAGDCAGGEVAMLEDVISGVEHLFMKTHTGQILPDGLPVDFPYRDRPTLMAKIQIQRAKALEEAKTKAGR